MRTTIHQYHIGNMTVIDHTYIVGPPIYINEFLTHFDTLYIFHHSREWQFQYSQRISISTKSQSLYQSRNKRLKKNS